jgi:hypothetical protein
MAVVSVLEALALIALIGGGFFFYRRLTQVIAGIEERHIAPVSSRVNAILDDVKGVSTVVRGATDIADSSERRGLSWLLTQVRHILR